MAKNILTFVEMFIAFTTQSNLKLMFHITALHKTLLLLTETAMLAEELALSSVGSLTWVCKTFSLSNLYL